MQTPPADVVLVGYGEIGTKSSTVRAKMERRLRENVAAVLADRGVAADVERQWSRLVVHTDEAAAAAAAVAEVPGVVWARPALAVAPELSAVRDALTRIAASHGDESFAVRARRVGPEEAHPFSSRDLEIEGGAAVETATGAPVDLDDPGRTYRVECREETAYVSVAECDGPGGLPAGTQGTVVVLVSGGLDSPVAMWELLRRGADVAPVYVDLGDYGGPDHRARAVETVRTVARRVPHLDVRLRVVPGGDVVDAVASELDDTRMLSLRRAMLRMADEIADEVGAHGVVTGEALGQKSSQTGPNLDVTARAVDRTVYRPLLTWDKTDIVAAARDLGTYTDATLPVGCDRVAPSHPETNASLAAVEAAEPDDLLAAAARAARDCETVDL